MSLTPTLHKVLGHSKELIVNNMCKGIGHLSEEGLEAGHKFIRRFRASWTLQLNDDANLKDLIKKMWLISDPLFYSFRRVIRCPKCGSTDHQRKCPMLKDITNKSETEQMVEDFFLD